MVSPRFSRILDQLFTGILVGCAIVVTAVVVRREMAAPPTTKPMVSEQADWRDFIDTTRTDGASRARVAVVVFGDYQCPYCRVLAERLAEIAGDYDRQVVVQNRHFPLPQHTFAFQAAVASECANEQGLGDEMHMALFAKQDSLGRMPWRDIAASIRGVDLNAFDDCIDDEKARAVVVSDTLKGRQLDINGTPTVLVNQQRVTGAPIASDLRRLIEIALKESAP